MGNNLRNVVVSLTEEEYKAFDLYCNYHKSTKQKILRDYISSILQKSKVYQEESDMEDFEKTKVNVFKKKSIFRKKKY